MPTIPVSDVRFVRELYPRAERDDSAIERYRAAIDRLPPIAVARDNVLVDGYNRWQAHQREGVEQIEVEDLGNLTDTEILTESIRRNASHGWQLSARDKRRLANQLWPTLDRETRVAYLAELLSVSERTIQSWTREARQSERAEQQAKAWDLWLDCLTQQVIAAEMGLDEATISRWLQERRSAEMQPPASRQHFDVWSFQSDSNPESYFGKLPVQVVENLLWFYTEPGQIVVDLFAGSGTTIDVAKQMGRRVWASDRQPSTPLLPIHEHDVANGWPDEAPNRADFVLLDPPYWKQAAGRYSEDPEDLGNMTLEDFLVSWEQVVKTCADHLADGGRLSYIVSPAEDRDADRVVDLALLMYEPCRDAGLSVERRIIVPYTTQQATGQQVEWARENRKMLKLYRDLVVVRA